MASDRTDYYEVLGVPRDANADLIHRQYRKLIKQEHPDRFAGMRARALAAGDAEKVRQIDTRMALAEKRSRLINRAYDVLSDPRRRDQYDRGVSQSPPPPARPQGPPKIVLSTSRVDLGAISAGVTRPFDLTIDNLGGMPSQISIDWENDPLWAGELTIITDPSNTFPILVKTEVITAKMRNTSYSGRLVVRVDGKAHPFEVSFSIRAVPISHGGLVPITGSPPGVPAGAAPMVTFSRLRVDHGYVTRGRKLTTEITISNTGGMPRHFSIDWKMTPPWARLTILPDPQYTFPVKVTISIDTEYLAYGTYPLLLLVSLDSELYRIPVTFEVHDPASPVATPRPTTHRSAPVRTATPGRGAVLVPVFVLMCILFSQMLGAAGRTSSIPVSTTASQIAGDTAVARNTTAAAVAFPTRTPTATPPGGRRQTLTPSPTSSPGPSPTPTNTAIPTAVPTITTTPQPNLVAAPAGWRLLSREELGKLDKSPSIYQGGANGMLEENGAFQWPLRSWVERQWSQVASAPGNLTDFYITARVQQNRGNPGVVSIGFIYHYRNASQYMTYTVASVEHSQDGVIRIQRQLGEKSVTEQYPLDALSPDGAVITLIMQGSQHYYYVNNSLIHQETITDQAKGKIGLFAEILMPNTLTAVSFDNVQVYVPAP